MYHKNADLDPITQRLNWSDIVYRYITISKKILKSKENMLYFHNPGVPAYTYHTHVLQYRV